MTDTIKTTDVPAPAALGSFPAAAKPLKSGKNRRVRPRRRGAESENESDDDAAGSDGSLTDASSVSEDEDDSDDDAEADKADASGKQQDSSPAPAASAAASTGATDPALPSAFADVSSSTPLAWTDQPDAGTKVEDVTYEEFSGRGRGRGRGRGAARGAANGSGERRELSEEERAKLAEKRERRKEKVKEKRRKEKEAKLAEKAAADGPAAQGHQPEASGSTAAKSAVATPAKRKAKKDLPKTDPVTELSEQATALTLQDGTAEPAAVESSAAASSTPAGARRPNNRDTYREQVSADPKVTPRVGGFWTHDQRHHQAAELGGGYGGRGMGGFPRGHQGFRGDQRGFARGFRGRGRGFGPGPGHFGPNGRMGQQEIVSEEKDGRLEMDKLEEAEKARAERVKQAREEAARREEELQARQAEEKAQVEVVQEAAEEKQEEVQVMPPPKAGSKWGHEGFEQQVEEERYRAFRGGFRGGRGRARGFMGRGGFFAPGPRAPINPAPTAPPQVGTAPAAPTSAAVETPTAALAPAPSQLPAEDQLTQNAVEDLLADQSSVTVHLPGSKESINFPRPAPVQVAPATPAEPAATEPPQPPSEAAAPAIAPDSAAQPFIPGPSPLPTHLTGGSHRSHAPSPFAPGSDNGSAGSSLYQVPPPPFLPPGIGIAPNGEYCNMVNGAPVDFVPVPVHPDTNGQVQGRPFFPGQQRQLSGFNQYSPSGSYSPSPQPMYYNGIPTPPVPQMNGFDPNLRSDSPFSPGNPYANGAQSGQGYFIPPVSTKRVLIRDPSGTTASGAGDAAAASQQHGKGAKSSLSINGNAFVPQYAQQQQPQYYPQAYNPYAVAGMGEEYGYGWQVPAQGQVPVQAQCYAGEQYAYQNAYGY